MKLGAIVTMAAGLVCLAAGGAPAVWAQQTGVSHPEDIPVTTSVEGIAQPVVYEPQTTRGVSASPANAALKQRTPSAEAVAYVPGGPLPAAAVPPPAMQPAVQPVPELRAAAEPAQVERVARQEPPQQMIVPADPDASIVTRVPGPANQIPTGSMLKVRLREKLSTGFTRPGALFTAELEESVERDGRILLPAGSLIRGKVSEVHGGKRSSGTASIHLAPTSIVLPDGTTYALRAQVIDTSLYRQQKVDDEGTILRSDHVKGTVSAFGLSTGSGAAAGAVFGGWPGAIIGAGVGAGVSTVVWLRQDHQTELPVGTGLTFSMTSPLTVGPE